MVTSDLFKRISMEFLRLEAGKVCSVYCFSRATERHHSLYGAIRIKSASSDASSTELNVFVLTLSSA